MLEPYEKQGRNTYTPFYGNLWKISRAIGEIFFGLPKNGLFFIGVPEIFYRGASHTPIKNKPLFIEPYQKQAIFRSNP